MEMKYAFPDHAQRMSTLFASDKLLADCRSREEGMGSTPHVHECVGWEAKRQGGAVAHAMCRRGFNRRSGGTTWAERTSNIIEKPWVEPMLDVSKLSGWLNADACCRVERGSVGGGAACGQAGGRVGWGGRLRQQQGGL